MKTPRLDWMKFNIYDFVHSEDVEAMSAEEVGQYILLMAAAWVGGKDCTLPNDEGYLARKARGTVSAKVMAKFTSTSDGRLVNEVQREIWIEQVGNFQAASEAGKRGRAKQLDKTLPDPLRTTPGETPGDKNGMDWNGNDKNGTENAIACAAAVTNPIENSFSNGNSNRTSSPSAIKPPQPVQSKKTTPVPPAPSLSPEDARILKEAADYEFGLLSRTEQFADYLYDSLPEQDQSGAFEACGNKWREKWAEDFDSLAGEPAKTVFEVIDFVQQSKWKKFIHRAKTLVEKYELIRADMKKVKSKGKDLPLTPKEAARLMASVQVEELL